MRGTAEEAGGPSGPDLARCVRGDAHEERTGRAFLAPGFASTPTVLPDGGTSAATRPPRCPGRPAEEAGRKAEEAGRAA